MRYAYIPAKRSGKVHELDESGRTYCQAENSSKRLILTEQKPVGRRDCYCCKGVKIERTHGVLDAEFRSIVK